MKKGYTHSGSDMPLAARMRPTSFDTIVGQDHLVGVEGIITKLLDTGFFPSIILWGPPGTGKTTIANALAAHMDADFIAKSAVTLTLEELRTILKKARDSQSLFTQKTILFLDELHRFNKAQQDALLGAVEDGVVTFVGATTENPSFEVITPLLSRCRVFVLHPHTVESLTHVLDRALRVLKRKMSKNVKEDLIELCDGDARILLTILEIAAHLTEETILTDTHIREAAQQRTLSYDKDGEDHYNTISAFIKSMRASDGNASLYYLARMVDAGEDPLYIARRMIVFASEDIGLAQPTALVVANAVFDACHKIGYPECQENLAHGTVYLAQAKKDRRAYDAYMAALSDVKKYGSLPVPMSIRNAPTKLMKDLGYGKGYDKYTHESLLPDKLKGKKYI